MRFHAPLSCGDFDVLFGEVESGARDQHHENDGKPIQGMFE